MKIQLNLPASMEKCSSLSFVDRVFTCVSLLCLYTVTEMFSDRHLTLLTYASEVSS